MLWEWCRDWRIEKVPWKCWALSAKCRDPCMAVKVNWATKITPHIYFYMRVDLECLRERKMLLRERLRKQMCSAKVAKDDNMQRCVMSNWGFGTQTLRKVRERSAKVARKLRCPKSRGSLLQEVHIKVQKNKSQNNEAGNVHAKNEMCSCKYVTSVFWHHLRLTNQHSSSLKSKVNPVPMKVPRRLI